MRAETQRTGLLFDAVNFILCQVDLNIYHLFKKVGICVSRAACCQSIIIMIIVNLENLCETYFEAFAPSRATVAKKKATLILIWSEILAKIIKIIT